MNHRAVLLPDDLGQIAVTGSIHAFAAVPLDSHPFSLDILRVNTISETLYQNASGAIYSSTVSTTPLICRGILKEIFNNDALPILSLLLLLPSV